MFVDVTDAQRIISARMYASELDSETAVIELQT